MSNQVEPQSGLAQAIRRLRAERGLSQEQLGLEAGIHPTWISHIESGRINPKWGNVQRIADVLEVRLSELAAMAEDLDLKVGTAPQPRQNAGGQ
jgi:transcriptional regulator with XRE-family HTH domain